MTSDDEEERNDGGGGVGAWVGGRWLPYVNTALIMARQSPWQWWAVGDVLLAWQQWRQRWRWQSAG